MAAIRDSADVWLLQGPLGVYLLERLFVSEQVVPFFPFFVFGCCLSISYPHPVVHLRRQTSAAGSLRRISAVRRSSYMDFCAVVFFQYDRVWCGGQLLALRALYVNPTAIRWLACGVILRHPFSRNAATMLRAAALVAVATGMYQSPLLSVAGARLGDDPDHGARRRRRLASRVLYAARSCCSRWSLPWKFFCACQNLPSCVLWIWAVRATWTRW